MAVSVTGKALLDTNVFIDYLRADFHADWNPTRREQHDPFPFLLLC